MDQLHRQERELFRVNVGLPGLGNRRGSARGAGPRRSFILLWIGLTCLSSCEFQHPPEEGTLDSLSAAGDPESGVVGMLEASAQDWNAGNLSGFLDDYWESDSLTFLGANGLTRGWRDLESRYLTTYWAPGAIRDSLRFEVKEVRSLGPDHALALGRYVLYRPEEDGRITASGFFSLVLRRADGEWKILHDHTSPSQDDSEEG